MAFEEEDAVLPPGYVSEPSDELLLSHFLINKITSQPLLLPQDFFIPEIDLYDKPPWELFRVASSSRYLPDSTFYCFVRVKRSSAKDRWLQRKPRGGTWVANGTPCNVLRHGRAVAGTITALKFFRDGDERRSKKDRSLGTDWIMHEYCLRPSLYEEIASCQGKEIILYRIHRKRSRKASEDEEQVATVMTAVGHVALPSPLPPTGYINDVVARMMPMAAAGHVALPPAGYIDDVVAATMPMAAWEKVVTPSLSAFDYKFPLMYN